MPATPEQLHAALVYCMEFARKMLEEAGEFYPFASFINSSSQVEALGAWLGEEHPNPQDVYVFLSQSLQAKLNEGGAMGTALCVNVNIPAEYSPPLPDGLRVHLETAGYSRFVYVPYEVTKNGWLNRKRAVRFAEPFSVELDPQT